MATTLLVVAYRLYLNFVFIFYIFCTGTKIRTRNNGFGDRYDTISLYPCILARHQGFEPWPSGLEPEMLSHWHQWRLLFLLPWWDSNPHYYLIKSQDRSQLRIQGNLVEPTGYDPVPLVFQTSAMTTSATAPYILGVWGVSKSRPVASQATTLPLSYIHHLSSHPVTIRTPWIKSPLPTPVCYRRV